MLEGARLEYPERAGGAAAQERLGGLEAARLVAREEAAREREDPQGVRPGAAGEEVQEVVAAGEAALDRGVRRARPCGRRKLNPPPGC